MRVREPAEDGAFTLKSLHAQRAIDGDVQELDRDPAFKPAVVTLGEPHTPHAAVAEMTDDAIMRNDSTDH